MEITFESESEKTLFENFISAVTDAEFVVKTKVNPFPVSPPTDWGDKPKDGEVVKLVNRPKTLPDGAPDDLTYDVYFKEIVTSYPANLGYYWDTNGDLQQTTRQVAMNMQGRVFKDWTFQNGEVVHV